MTAFVKFDPWAAIAAVRRGEDKPETLAGLATLAGGDLKTENLDDGNSPTTTAKPRGDKYQISRVTPAKVAKVAKVDPPAAEPFPFARVLDALERRCPDHVEAERWRQCVRDAERFIASWGDKAHALGWTAGELFGLHRPPAKPHPSYSRLSRYDATGLLWLLQGRRVVALTNNTAAIQNPATGNILTYRKARKPALGPLGDSLDDFTG
jgi:hypothetical protein